MPKLFFTSDLHLSHPNILRYEPGRVEAVIEWLELGVGDPSGIREEVEEGLKDKKSEKFQWVLEMHDELLIRNWNLKVKPEDTVIFLGDFAFCNKASKEDKNWDKIEQSVKDKIIEYGNRLNGHKIMIMGNHDWRGTYHQGPMKGIHYVTPEIKEFWHKAGFEEVYPNAQMLKKYFECSHEPSPYYSPAMVRVNIYAHVHSDARFATETENSFCVCCDRHGLAPVEYKFFNYFEAEPDLNFNDGLGEKVLK